MAMIKQYRLERYNGFEWLVCELYFKHTWTKSEMDAYLRFVDEHSKDMPVVTQADFSSFLDDWLEEDHSPGETFYGLTEPIPSVESIPHLVIRGAIVDNKIASLNVDFMRSVTSLEVMDVISKFFDFVRSPHWRNTILSQISNYGSLFGSDNDS